MPPKDDYNISKSTGQVNNFSTIKRDGPMDRKRTNDGDMRFPYLVSQISQMTNVAPDAVKDVLWAFIDISVEELVNRKRVLIPELAVMTARWVESSSTVPTTGEKVHGYWRINSRARSGLKLLMRALKRNPSLVINRNNWKDVVKDQYDFDNKINKYAQNGSQDIRNDLEHNGDYTDNEIDDLMNLLD